METIETPLADILPALEALTELASKRIDSPECAAATIARARSLFWTVEQKIALAESALVGGGG
jgi:hypothetical protein